MTPHELISKAKIISSSRFRNGVRADTLHLRYWRPVHGEFMTHRDFSRNGASGRAVPVMAVLARNETYVPRFKRNQSGMQPAEFLSADEQAAAEKVWMGAVDACREAARILGGKDGFNIHKQWPNRMIEWFGWIDVLVTSTRWSNWDALRLHREAQDEIRYLAEAMYAAREGAEVVDLKDGEWHLPYVTEQDRDDVARMVRDRNFSEAVTRVLGHLAKSASMAEISYANKVLLAISAARACRVSYAKLDGSPTTIDNDMGRFLLLAESAPLHASPLEHQCRGLTPADSAALQGNLLGTVQFRKLVPFECA